MRPLRCPTSGAGVVDAVGLEVTDLHPGQRVWLWHTAWQRTEGTAQEYVVVPEHLAVPLPDGESFQTGACLGIPALTAHRALTAHEAVPDRLTPGSLRNTTVLVTGGAGAVGHAAIQLAVWAGATVITTVSGDRKAQLAGKAGAHHVVKYRTEDTATRVRSVAPEGVDLIVEVNINANLDTDVDVIADSSTIAIYTDDESHLAVPLPSSMSKNIRYQFILTYTTTDQQKVDAVAGVSAALADGALRSGEDHGLPLTHYKLQETAAAHQAVEEGALGKVLIDVTAAFAAGTSNDVSGSRSCAGGRGRSSTPPSCHSSTASTPTSSLTRRRISCFAVSSSCSRQESRTGPCVVSTTTH